jgi:hypothetical protein
MIKISIKCHEEKSRYPEFFNRELRQLKRSKRDGIEPRL